MYSNIRLYLVLTILIFQYSGVYAVKATPYPVEIVQSDGSILTIRLHGDEKLKYRTTEDGFLILENNKGIYHYAKVTENGLVLSDIKAKNFKDRTYSEKKFVKQYADIKIYKPVLQKQMLKKAPSLFNEVTKSTDFPKTGSPKSLVILVNFKDKNYITPNAKQAFTDLLNKDNYSENGGTGSARDYFITSSFNQFSPQFDVVGPYTLPDSMHYYGGNVGDDVRGDDLRPREMVIDACEAADANGVNFANYDLDNDGIVDNVFIYYAGHNEAEGAGKNTVWPHRWAIGNFNNKFDNKAVYDYACTSELRGSSGTTMCGIGTFTHEFGHVLGLVDYYHTSEDKLTLERWSIMDAGAYNNLGRTPPLYSAYDRFELGWLTPSILSSATNIQLKPLQSTNTALLISETDQHNLQGRNPNPKEYFILENRRKTGFDAYLPGEGMLIWHIDYNQSAWNNNSPNNYSGSIQTTDSHMRVYLQPLSGQTTTPGAAFTSGSFIPTLWSGTELTTKKITEINVVSQDVFFKYRGGIFDMLPPVALPATSITNRNFVANWESNNNVKNYFLTAYRISQGKSKETEEFTHSLVMPKGWKTTVSAVTTSVNYSGTNIPALQFVKNNEYILTKQYPEVVDSLCFYIRSLNSTGSTVKVEAFDNSTWELVDNINVSISTHEIKKYGFATNKNYVRFKLTFLSANGGVAIDDITASYSSKLEYLCVNKPLTTTFDTLKYLIPNAEYRYKLLAEDYYENLTEVSNTIIVQTLAHDDSLTLRIDKVQQTNDYFVYPVNLNDPILIYDVSGRLVSAINPIDYKIKISAYLKKHGIYIIKAGNRQNRLIF